MILQEKEYYSSNLNFWGVFPGENSPTEAVKTPSKRSFPNFTLNLVYFTQKLIENLQKNPF